MINYESEGLQEKRKRLQKLHVEVRDQELRERNEAGYPAMKARFEGTYWKVRNCYSCPSKESDYWMLYAKVLEVLPDGVVKIAEAQIDCDGKVSIKPAIRYPWDFWPGGDWKSASEAEWDEALRKIEEVIQGLH